MSKKENKASFIRRWGLWITILCLFVGVPVGVYVTREIQIRAEINQVLHSSALVEKLEQSLRTFDKNALTEEGKIKSYRVDYETARINPMGGIGFDVYINDRSDLYIIYIVSRDIQGEYSFVLAESAAFHKMMADF